jgi:hypothetical protein
MAGKRKSKKTIKKEPLYESNEDGDKKRFEEEKTFISGLQSEFQSDVID